ncbi:MAG TPA: DUF899 family protein [Thermoleophilaceae bacterium]|nr:DUF899 family protein [Thermoleophilaceae bacterium]
MTEHAVGTRDEWQAARDELAKLEAEHGELGRKAAEKRRELPWVPVEKEYEFDTEDGKKTLASSSTAARSFSPTTSCSDPTTRLGPAPAAPTSGTSSTPRAST